MPQEQKHIIQRRGVAGLVLGQEARTKGSWRSPEPGGQGGGLGVGRGQGKVPDRL